MFVDLRGTSHRCATRTTDVFPSDGNRRGDSLNAIGSRFVELLKKLPCVSGKTFDVATLSLSIEGIERKARLTATADSAEGNQLTMRQVEIDFLQIVHGDAA